MKPKTALPGVIFSPNLFFVYLVTQVFILFRSISAYFVSSYRYRYPNSLLCQGYSLSTSFYAVSVSHILLHTTYKYAVWLAFHNFSSTLVSGTYSIMYTTTTDSFCLFTRKPKMLYLYQLMTHHTKCGLLIILSECEYVISFFSPHPVKLDCYSLHESIILGQSSTMSRMLTLVGGYQKKGPRL